MTQEEKLLLIDLSSRVQYNVLVEQTWFPTYLAGKVQCLKSIQNNNTVTLCWRFDNEFVPIHEIKPYLRSMSSMANEEVKDLIKVKILSKYGKVGDYFGFNNIKSIKNIHFSSRYNEWFCDVTFNTIEDKFTTCFSVGRVTWETTIAEIDWLNAHHFDYRGLIEKGLALEAKEKMYKQLNN